MTKYTHEKNEKSCYVCYRSRQFSEHNQFRCERAEHNTCNNCLSRIRKCPLCRQPRKRIYADKMEPSIFQHLNFFQPQRRILAEGRIVVILDLLVAENTFAYRVGFLKGLQTQLYKYKHDEDKEDEYDENVLGRIRGLIEGGDVVFRLGYSLLSTADDFVPQAPPRIRETVKELLEKIKMNVLYIYREIFKMDKKYIMDNF